MDCRPTLKVLLTLGAAVLWPLAASAQDADPRLIALSCAGCHGPEGHSPGAVPSINGRSAASLAEALRSFRADQRPSTVMGRIAKGYSDAEIEAVARDIAASWK
jgi:cytochrome subunit of sulfide dehydrogenase